jgi:serine/threonine protein kinase
MGVAFGRYEVIRRIATGGMAEIFLARERRMEGFERPVVLKRVIPQFAKEQDLTQMFLQESRTAALLEHPNIVRVYDFGQELGIFYLAMEFIHGETISEIWKQGVQQKRLLPLPYTLQIIADAAKGLDYAHKRRDLSGKPLGIVHRDISPQNIMVSFDGIVKVVDFGIAKVANKLQQTNAGIIKGKFAYMSPEQARGERVDARSDTFALGILLYELTTGRRLFRAPSDVQTIQKVASCEVVPPTERIPQYPKPLEQIVLKALAAQPQDRYQDGRDFAEAIEGYMRDRKLEPKGFPEYLRSLFPDKQEIDLTTPDADAETFLLGTSAPAPREEPAGFMTAAVPVVALEGNAVQVLLEESEGLEETNPGDLSLTTLDAAERAAPAQAPAPSPSAPKASPQAPGGLITQVPGAAPSGLLESPTAPPSRRALMTTGEYILQGLGKAPPSERNTRLVWLVLGGAVAFVGLVLAAFFLWGNAPVAVHSSAATGNLEIVTRPSEAMIYLDGSKQPDLTPTKLTGLTPGVPYTVKVSKEGYFPKTQEVTIDARTGSATINFVLNPSKKGKFQVNTNPPGASITLDGVDTGKRSPAPLFDVTLGEEHTLLLEKKGYKPETYTFSLSSEEEKNTALIALKVETQPDPNTSAFLGVVCTEQVSVFLGEVPIGKTPLEKLPVSAGRHDLVLLDARGKKHVHSLSLRPGEEKNVAFSREGDRLVSF